VPVQAATITKASTVPKAYLFYILFNSSYAYQQFGFVQVSSAALAAHQQLYLDITIPTGGYLYTYVANESNVSASTSVYFDDFNIIHTRSTPNLQVLQTSDYYPFGLQIAAQGYQKQSALDNDKLSNGGSELQDEFGLNVYWTTYRSLDPAIGRWWQVDPKTDNMYEWSPYSYSFNSPVIHNDPKGDIPILLATAGAGALIGAIAGAGVAVWNGERNLADVGKAAFAGGVGGAIIGSGAGLLGTTAVAGTGLMTNIVGRLVANAVVGIVSGGAEETTKQALSGNGMDPASIVKASYTGGLVNAIAGPIGKALAPVVSSLSSTGTKILTEAGIKATTTTASNVAVKPIVQTATNFVKEILKDITQKTIENKVQDKLQKK